MLGSHMTGDGYYAKQNMTQLWWTNLNLQEAIKVPKCGPSLNNDQYLNMFGKSLVSLYSVFTKKHFFTRYMYANSSFRLHCNKSGDAMFVCFGDKIKHEVNLDLASDWAIHIKLKYFETILL